MSDSQYQPDEFLLDLVDDDWRKVSRKGGGGGGGGRTDGRKEGETDRQRGWINQNINIIFPFF